MKLVFASNNKNKIQEIQALVPNTFQIVSLEDIGCFEDIPETADTIEGNAILKANYVTEKYGYDKEDTDTLSRNENLSETEEIKRMDDKLISAGDRLLLNTESLIKEILNRQLNGEDPGKLAYFFHRELACQITAACVKIRELSGCNKAALSGGVFQNRLLLELTDHMLLEQGFEVLKHQLLPPNDGGIALGQAVYAMAYLEKA